MGLLSSTVSITRYRVEGKIDQSVTETIAEGLKKNAISEIEDETSEMVVGWTSFENPYHPDFQRSSFVIGPYFVFSMRIDKKKIPTKIIKKQCAIEAAKRLTESGRDFLSRNEKKQIKEQVIDTLMLRMPSTPNVFDLIWDYENASVWLFSTQKAANEELETLFSKSFKLTLIRLFPYTLAELEAGLSHQEHDILSQLSPSKFTE